MDLATISTTPGRPDFLSLAFEFSLIIIHCITTMGKTILATLLALGSVSAGIVASTMPRPVERRSSATVNDTFQWVEGSGFHLVQCSPLPSSAEQSWLSLVLVCSSKLLPLVKDGVRLISRQYCDNDADCSDVKHVPAKRDICVRKSSNITDDYEFWPTSDWIHCKFEERGWFSWLILKGALLVFPGDFVG